MSTTQKVHDAIEVTFGLFDKAGDSFITREEFVQSLLAMQRVFNSPELFGEIPRELKTEDGIREWVDDVFLHFDTSNSDKLTFQEFKAAVKQHPALSLITSKYLSDECKDILGEGLRRRGSFRPRSNSRAGRNSITMQNIAHSFLGKKDLSIHNSLVDRDLRVLVCVDHDRNSLRSVESLHRFIRNSYPITLYHQPVRADALANGNARIAEMTSLLSGKTVHPIKFHVEVSDENKVIACCRYSDANNFDLIVMGHPGRESSSNLPWKMVENFSGIGVLIGHLPLDRPLVYMVVMDDSGSGRHAMEMSSLIVRKEDRILLLSTWKPPSMNDIGTAMNASTAEWNKYLTKLQHDAKVRGNQARDRFLASVPDLPPDHVATIAMEATTDGSLEEEVAKLGSTYEIHCLITGLRSNSQCKKLFTMFKKLPRTAITALLVMN